MPHKSQLNPKTLIASAYGNALKSQQPLARANLQRLRRAHPNKTPAQIITSINRTYITTVSTSGACAGLTAVAPNGAVQVPAALADLTAYLEASILYVLSILEIYSIDNTELRRTMVTAILLGDKAACNTINALAKRTVPHWSKNVIRTIPMSAINKANAILGPRFITKYGTKQGVLVLGKQVPMFIGAGIGAGGNAAFGWLTIRATRKLLGPPPESWNEFENGRIETNPSHSEI
ncbi:hypothetical protein [Actinomyces gerencseriae]|uniref:hypothetical protein n=1 Tax=Actinomyces gerencseriae TaxID=52769 RepID=UPI0009FF6AFF|nr:hypothetical protein [Actinomyces gerencseriae]